MTLVLSLTEATTRLAGIFAGNGVAPSIANSVATALVAAEADGLSGHGLSRLPTYLAMVAAGKIVGNATAVATRPRLATIAIDAGQGFAYPAVDLAVEMLPAVARAHGIAAASIHRSNHAGAVGHHVERLAKAGLVAIFFANTPSAIAPWGGRTAVFGTNPIAFAAPRPGAEPVVIDLALSKVARGVIVAAGQRGEAIPAGLAFDADGRPTTDAQAALGGTMAALGDAKGTALALMVEILAAALTGSHFAFEASSFLDAKGPPPETGQLILCIDPAGFGHASFSERMATLAAAIEDQEGARLPGQRRYQLREKAAREGLRIPPAIADKYPREFGTA